MKEDMTFKEHVLELRRRLFWVLVVIVGFSVLGYFAFPYFFDFILSILSEELYATKIYEAFLTRLRIAVLLGLLLTIPFLLYQIMSYILPGLKKKEKILIFSLLVSSFLLFLGGVYFGVKVVMPISMQFLKSSDFFPNSLNRLISYESFILFFFQFLVAFGLCLQFPVVLLLLLYYKVIKREKMVKFFRFFVAIALVASAILTPPDVISQLMLTAPMIVLYLICIILAKAFKWGK